MNNGNVITRDIDFVAFPHQYHALKAVAHPDIKYVWLCGGVGSGKTRALAQYFMDIAVEHDPGSICLWAGPNRDMYWRDSFLDVWASAFPFQGSLWSLHERGRELHIHAKGTTTVIKTVSAHDKKSVDNIASINVSHVGCDEPTRWKHSKVAWRNITQRARLPTRLGHNKIFLVGSPRGFNWTADEFGCTDDHPSEAWNQGYISKRVEVEDLRYAYYIRCATTDDNEVYKNSAYALNMLEEYSLDLYRQEAEGHLVAFQGLVFREFNQNLNVISNSEADNLWSRTIANKRIGGCDFGGISANVVVGRTDDNLIVVPDLWYKDTTNIKDPLTAQGLACVDLEKRWNLKRWIGDNASPNTIKHLRSFTDSQGNRHRLSIKPSDKDWSLSVNRIRGLLCDTLGNRKLLIAERCVPLIKELNSYVLPENIDYNKPLSQQTEGHDHGIDALRYAVMAVLRNVVAGTM